MDAAQNGHKKVVQLLVDLGADVNAADNSLVAVPLGGDMEARLDARCAEKVAEFAKPCRDVGARFLPLITSSDGVLHASTRNFVSEIERRAQHLGVVARRDVFIAS